MAKKQEQTLEELQQDMEDFSNILELSSSIELPNEESENLSEEIKEKVSINEDKIKEMSKILHKKVFRDTLKLENLSILSDKNKTDLSKLDREYYFKATKKMANSKIYKFAKVPNPYISNKNTMFSEKLVLELSRVILENKFTKEFQYKFNGVMNSIVNYGLLKKMYDSKLLNNEEFSYFSMLTIFIFGASNNLSEDIKTIKENLVDTQSQEL